MNEFEDLMTEAQKLVKRVKNTMKVVYQLAFIVTSEAPEKDDAYKLLKKMVDEGIITEAQMYKALNDVERWRKRFLDRTFDETMGSGVRDGIR